MERSNKDVRVGPGNQARDLSGKSYRNFKVNPYRQELLAKTVEKDFPNGWPLVDFSYLEQDEFQAVHNFIKAFKDMLIVNNFVGDALEERVCFVSEQVDAWAKELAGKKRLFEYVAVAYEKAFDNEINFDIRMFKEELKDFDDLEFSFKPDKELSNDVTEEVKEAVNEVTIDPEIMAELQEIGVSEHSLDEHEVEKHAIGGGRIRKKLNTNLN